MQKEAKARLKINKLLEEARWRFFDDENGRVNVFWKLKMNPKNRYNLVKFKVSYN